MSDVIPVIKLADAIEQAYESGYDKFSNVPTDHPEEFDLDGFRDSADYANNVLPSLRALSGHEDGGHGTYTGDCEVAVLEAHQEDDVPAKADVCAASTLLTEDILPAWERGARDAGRGKDRYESAQF